MQKIKTKKDSILATHQKHKKAKQAICDLLLKAIQQTTAGNDVTALRYDPEKEVVYVDFECSRGGRVINVACDSGWAMIKDIVNHIDIG